MRRLRPVLPAVLVVMGLAERDHEASGETAFPTISRPSFAV